MRNDFSPIDLPTNINDRKRAGLWTGMVISTASLLLALLNAEAVADWADALAPTAWTAPIVATADSWRDMTVKTGLSAPRDFLHRYWKKLEALHFSNQEGEEAVQPPES
ncbi:MAG: hypothetical protein ABF760_04900 [Zymomonas mobilis]|uniref:Uncharacterized protein n=1 Tax=Zymomonas mobilis TaxID=542 RepID=A0A542W077_ZYMMB|nr:hypothetical protein [Zymomonas mobilis]TQL16933.1 hypothetical protein FBY58_0484 [Zymomonas mobilis]